LTGIAIKSASHRLTFAQANVRHFLQEPGMPAAGGSLILIGLIVREQQCQLEGFG